jgi:hypothetical protein
MPHFTRRALLSSASAALLGCATETVAPAPLAPPVTFTTEEDHANMMAQLGITQLRPGRNGLDPTHPNFANYDESRANPHSTLPDPLRTKDGRAVTTPQMWWNVRRPEIVEDFEREIYGRVPANTPSVRWEVTETKEEMAGAVRTNVRYLTGHVDNSAYPAVSVDMEMLIVLPADAAGPAPIVLNFLWITPPPFFRNLPPEPSPTWRDLILAKGWGYAILVPNSIQDDNGAGLTRGIIGLCNRGQPRRPEDWGALRAWGWGAGKAIEFFASDPAIDERRVGLQGHSRYGKAALVAMAFDERIACGFISSSGMGGANLARRNWGEIVENLAGSGEYHWMAGNYIKYGGPLNAGDMPVDAHELIALCAPRPVFISSGAQEGDGWVDARGMFMAAVGAGPVYRLLGKRDLGTTTFPPIETTLIDGDVAYRQHGGGHTPGPNWPVFLTFAERYFNAQH